MADKAVFEIIVTDKGLKVNQKNVENLGKSVDNTNRKTREAGKAQDELNYKLNQGATQVSSAAKSFSKLNQAIGNGPNGLVGAYATLAANAFAISAAFNVLKEASKTTQILKGLEIQGARLGVTLTNTARSVKELSGDMLSLADAMRATAQASAAGFGQDSIKQLTQVARDASVALGRDVGDSLDRLIRGTTKLEPELLDELGIMVKLGEATSRYALENGKTASSLTSFEKRQAYLNAVLQEGQDKFGGIADQVKVDPYQKLASSFADLVQKLLELANALGVSRIVQALADNSYLLGAAMFYFASTISRSLLPGLYELGKGTQVTAANLAYLSKEKYLAAAASQKLAIAEGDLALQQARTLEVTSKSAGAYTNYATAVRMGTATDEMRAKALRSLTNSINYYSKQSDKFGDTDKGKAAAAYVEVLKRQKESILNLAATEVAAQNATQAAIQRTTAARREAARVRLQSAAAGKAADGIELIGQGQIREGWTKVKDSLSTNIGIMRDRMKPEAIQAWTGSATGGFTKVTTSLKTMSMAAVTASISFAKLLISPSAWASGAVSAFNSIRAGLASMAATGMSVSGILGVLRTGMLATGVAAVTFGTLVKTGMSLILYGIPIIGQIIMLLTMLWEVGKWAWEYFFPPSEAQKALEDSQKALEETITRVAETGRVTSAVFSDAYSSVTESAQAYKALSNTLVEVADNLRKVRAAREQLGQAGAANVEEALKNSYEEQVGRSLSKSVVNSEEFKSIASLTKLGFEPLNKEIMDATVNSREFQAANDTQKVELMAAATERLSRKYASVGMAVEELNNSYKKLGDATQQFIQKAAPTTSYDGLVEGLTASTASAHRLRAELEQGTITVDDFNKQLTNIPEDAIGLLTSATYQQVEALKSLNAQIAATQRELDNPGTSSAQREQAEQRLTNLKASQLSQQAKLAPLLEKELDIQRKKMLDLQRQSVLAAGMLKVEQTRLSTIQKNLSDTGAGYLVQQAHEEKMREMEASKIRAETAVLSLLNLQAERRLDAAKAELQALNTRITNLETGKEELNLWEKIWNVIKGVSNTLLGTDLELTSVEALRAQAEQVQATIIQLEADTAKLGNAIDAANLEVTSILAQNLTDAQKAAEALRLDFENISRLGKNLNDLIPVVSELSARRAISEQKFRSEAMDTASSMITASRNQIAALNRETKARQDALDIQIASVNADLARAGIGESERRALTAKLSLLREEKTLLTEAEQIRTKAYQQTLALDLIDRFSLDTMANGLEIQRDSLELLQKELDLKSERVNQEKELRLLRAKLIAGGESGSLNQDAQRAIEAKAAREAYQLGLDQYDLKMAAIDAEYALLNAQKLQLTYQLQTQKAVIEAMNRADGVITAEEKAAVDQVDNAISSLNQINYDDLKVIAQQAEKNTLELLRLRAIEADNPLQGAFTGITNGVLSAAIAFNNFASQQERRDLFKPLEDSIERTHEVVLPDFERATREAESRLSTFKTTLNSVNFNFEDLATTLDQVNTQFNTFLQRLSSEGAIQQQASSMGRVPSSGVISPGQYGPSGDAGGMYGAARGNGRTHKGQDYGFPDGTPLLAQLGGTLQVLNTNAQSLGGIQAALVTQNRNGENLVRLGYAHLKSIDASNGAVISAGQQFATSGRTGRTSTGGTYDPHLHFTVSYWSNGRWVEMDPREPLPVNIKTQLDALTVRSVTTAELNTNGESSSVVNQLPAVGEAAGVAAAKAIVDAIANQTPTSVNTAANPQPPVAANDNPSPVPAAAQPGADQIDVQGEKMKKSLRSISALANSTLTPIAEQMKGLGPDGEILAAATSGMNAFVQQSTASFAVMKMSAQDWEDATGKAMSAADMKMVKIAATAQMVSAAIAMVAQTLQAMANARIAGIDKEIAAEEKRDGKSQASVEKVNALAKKKDDIARKSFNVQKKLQIAQAIINTASAVTMALATLPMPWGGIMAGIVGAMGMAQVALIASTQYESSYTPKSISTPSNLSIGKRDSGVNLAMGPNANAGGEVGYLRGAAGTGTSASNYNAIGSAYGGDLSRGYGNRGFIVGEKGPELITPETPINVTPANENVASAPVNATINIQAIDSQGVQDVLVAQKGNIIQMLRQAANANGQRFLEDVNVNVYTRPSVGKLL